MQSPTVLLMTLEQNPIIPTPMCHFNHEKVTDKCTNPIQDACCSNLTKYSKYDTHTDYTQ